MKIKKIETFTLGTTVAVVRVTTDDGSQGYGQTAPFNADITATVLNRQIAPHALGEDATDLEALKVAEMAADAGSRVCPIRRTGHL